MNTKIWIDDLRNPPDDSYDIARNYQQAIDLLTKNQYDHAVFDHDLADFDKHGNELTGWTILKWLTQRKKDGFWVPKTYKVISANSSVVPKMNDEIKKYLTVDVKDWDNR